MPTASMNLSEITCSLRRFLDTLLPQAPGAFETTRALSPEEMTRLLSWLMRAGQCLHCVSPDHRLAHEREITEYRKEIQRLHAVLPSIHSALLKERSRLESQRERLSRAGEWMRVSRQTL